MESPVPAEPILPASWPEFLAQVQQAVQQAEADAQEREQALQAGSPPGPAPDREAAWRQCSERLKERLDGLEACAARAQQSAAEADAAITAGEEVIRRWLAACQTVGQQLAQRASPGLG
jgi:hypothetical protein